jgi:hypothetical protein
VSLRGLSKRPILSTNAFPYGSEMIAEEKQ